MNPELQLVHTPAAVPQPPRRDAPVDPVGIAWVDDVDAYGASTTAWADGVVPIIRPADPERAARWAAVLAWYGAREVEHGATASGIQPTHVLDGAADRDRDVVLALDASFMAIAQTYAFVSGRTFVRVDIEGACAAIHALAPRSVAVVGGGDSLRFGVLTELRRILDVPWGVLSARDDAALTFLLAKQWIGRRSPVVAGWGAVDAMRGEATSISDDGRRWREEPMRGALTRAWLVERSWRALSVTAHGEGSHLNLEDVVCCGATSAREHDRKGEVVHGCGVVDGSRRCKRVRDGSKTILRFGDVRAQTICLHSCIGFSTAGEIYPSDNSLLLDAAEGFAADVITTDRIIPIARLTPLAALGLLHRGASAHATVEALDDVASFQVDCRPYLLFGDPLATRESDDRRPALVREDAKACDRELLRTWRSEERSRHVVGRSRVLTIADAARLERPPLRVTDSFERLQAVLTRGARAASRARAIESSLRIVLDTGSPATEAAIASLDVLARRRSEVETAIDRATHGWTSARASGVWTRVLDQRIADIATAFGGWDAQMCDVAQRYLLDRALEEDLVVGRWPVAGADAGVCDRCASPMRRHRHASAFADAPLLERVDCPLCGARSCGFDGGATITATAPHALVPGGTLALEIAINDGRDRLIADAPGAQAPSGWLLTKITDRGTQAALFQDRRRVAGGARLDIAIPAEISMELHIVKWILVRDLDVAYLRHRVPGRAGAPSPA